MKKLIDAANELAPLAGAVCIINKVGWLDMLRSVLELPAVDDRRGVDLRELDGPPVALEILDQHRARERPDRISARSAKLRSKAALEGLGRHRADVEVQNRIAGFGISVDLRLRVIDRDHGADAHGSERKEITGFRARQPMAAVGRSLHRVEDSAARDPVIVMLHRIAGVEGKVE